jgi:CBS domain-containing protein
MKAHDVMTWGVISVEADASVIRAAQLMVQNRISGLPVVDAEGALVGMVTEGDFLRRGELGTQRRRPRWLEFLIGPGRLATEYVRACGRKVAEIMTPHPYTITQNTSLEDVVQLMEKHRVKRLPVVENNVPIGMVSRANLLHGLASLAPEAKPQADDDSTIRTQILAECNKQSWAPAVNVIVRNGVVELWGAIMDERERQALIVVAENVAGVKSVRDHLVWVEPMSGMAVLSEEDEARAKASLGASRNASRLSWLARNQKG